MKEDKFTTFMLLAKDYVMERWVYFVGGLVLVFALVIAVTMMKSSMAKSETEAIEIFNRAQAQLQSKSYQIAIIDFQTIIDDFGSSDLAEKAQFNLGNAYFAAKSFDLAREAFETYLADNNNDDRYFTTSALAGVAACMAGSGDIAGAADKYREAGERFTEFEPAGEFYLKAMQFYLESDNEGSAKVMYAVILKEFEGTRFYTESQRIAGEYNIAQ